MLTLAPSSRARRRTRRSTRRPRGSSLSTTPTQYVFSLTQRVLFLFCAANELFFVCLYLMDFYKQPLGLQVAPFLPQSLLQLASAQKNSLLFRIIYVWIPSLTWPQLLGAFTFPICAGKQIINGVQFWKAAKALCDMDDMERRARSTRRT